MIRSALDTLLSGQKYLLLQGPMGPFFRHLGDWLESKGREARQVVFNGGDQFYARKGKSLAYRGVPDDFGAWLGATRGDWPFDTLVCFGDCRPLHQAARRWAQAQGIRFLVFEEGYLRPCFITLEENGVNGFSGLPREAAFYRGLPAMEPEKVKDIVPSFWLRARHACVYYLMACMTRRLFPGYLHHKIFSIRSEAYCWLKAGSRKIWYGINESRERNEIINKLSKNFDLVILQVFNDSQIIFHSKYNDINEYLYEVIHSFAKHANTERHLVIKHHPMDRGHRDYTNFIQHLAEEYNLEKRIHYIHDIPLPELIHNSHSVITINSTVGLSALIHRKPLKVMGNAFYDINGLTYQGSLESFWDTEYDMDHELFENFRKYLRKATQINAVYYCRKFSWGQMLSFIEQEHAISLKVK
ncbi:capsular biosynthesis protein [Cronobacter dublinensis]|uniref:capsule biosynthesis protein n=1 Tax=Cronobacter dublinensis TaxID=413497 RepID=UPI0024AF8F94|nr:capsular biosynthesis protein [Cronobacter dublinensis]MDI7493791.1 capsular biosynthesis protein [Cronobacter dublinensis]